MNSTISRNPEILFRYMDIPKEPEYSRAPRAAGPPGRPVPPPAGPPHPAAGRPPAARRRAAARAAGGGTVGERRPRRGRRASRTPAAGPCPRPGRCRAGPARPPDRRGRRTGAACRAAARCGPPVPRRRRGVPPSPGRCPRSARCPARRPRRTRRTPAGPRPSRCLVAPPGGLPAVAHHPGQARHEQVGGGGVEHVAAAGDDGAVLQRGQVDGRGQQPRVGHRLAVDPQPGHPAVGEDRQPHVGERAARRLTSNSLRASPATALRGTSVVHGAAASSAGEG